ncbi:MAG: acetylxylan esterase [Acidobacteria bacterium]|nr:acetylxylan esterase [Acidobacteriota bacterium]
MKPRWWWCGLALAFAGSLPAVDLDAREQLIRQLNERAFAMLEARAGTLAAIQTREAADKRRAEVRRKVLRAMNGLPDLRGPLNAKTTGTLERDGFRIEKVTFESLPGFVVTADLYLPPSGTGRVPAVVMTPGHGASGKAGEYVLAANFARNGIAALAYDVMGQGERLQYFDPATGKSRLGGPTAEHAQAALQSEALGEHISRYFVWDAMRAIDYLSTRREIDPQRIGAFGCSGGGTVTAYLAALDDRVKAAASACYITAFAELLPSRTGVQEAEQSIPGFIAAGLDFADWVELAAPRPYAIVSTTEDMFPIEGARRTFEEAKRFWGLYGAADRIEWITGPGGHGALVPVHPKILAFFLKHLKNSAAEPTYTRIAPDKPADLFATAEGQVHGTTIGEIVRKRAESLRPAGGPADFRAVAGIQARPGEAPGEMPGQLFLPDAPAAAPYPAVLVVSGEPPAELSAIPRGRLVLVIHPRPWPRGTEAAKSPMQGAFYLLSLRAQLTGLTLVGMRADDIIRAVDFLAARPDVDQRNIAAYASGPSAIALLHAAALDSRIRRVVVDHAIPSFRAIATEPLHRNAAESMIPGVLRHYDIADLIRAVAPRTVEVLKPVDGTGAEIR